MSKKYKDLEGQRFGRLTALEYVGNYKWKCRCDCGNEIITTAGHLYEGHTQSCGCLKQERLKDLTGQRFGRLTVLEYIQDQHKWLCKCDCGEETTVSGPNLRSGSVTSCGCLLREVQLSRVNDITGRHFGRLTAIEYLGKGKWRCRCDCGKEVVVIGQNLRRGRTKSCGCLRNEQAVNRKIRKKLGRHKAAVPNLT